MRAKRKPGPQQKTDASDAHSRVILGFERQCLQVAIEDLCAMKKLRPSTKASRKYRQIAASIRQVGIVEPPVVCRDPLQHERYFLLDGHLRVEVLKDLGHKVVEVLVSTDDESFTFNRQLSRLSTVQEHKMVVRAIERGVPAERLAAALSVDVHSIQRRIKLLDGICPEAEELLKDRPCPNIVFQILKKLAPLRQVEAAELMRDQNRYSAAFANAIVAATPQSQLADSSKPKKVKGITTEQMARMERELANLQRSVKAIEDSYSPNNLHLTVVRRFLAKLIANPRIAKHLTLHRPEFLAEFQRIAEMDSLVPA